MPAASRCSAHPGAEGCRSAPHGDGGYPRAPQYRRPTPRTGFPRCLQALPVFIKSQTHTVTNSSLHSSAYRAPSNGAEILPRGPINTLGERPEGPGRENEKLPGTGNPQLGATKVSGPLEASTIHPHCSPGEGGRGNPDPRALLPVREGRGRSGQGTVGSSPRGHTRAGTKHGSPPQFEGGGDRIGGSNTATNTGVEPTGRAMGHGGGPPPQERPRTITRSRISKPGREPPERVGLPQPVA